MDKTKAERVLVRVDHVGDFEYPRNCFGLHCCRDIISKSSHGRFLLQKQRLRHFHAQDDANDYLFTYVRLFQFHRTE
jgi:hypothetical protein